MKLLCLIIVGMFLIIQAGPGSCLEFQDEVGRTVSITPSPMRIISLAPSITEILFYLGLESRILGVTDFCNFPSKAKEKNKVGSYLYLNLEKIVSLQPDLIIGIAEGKNQAVVKRLEALGLPIYVLKPENMENVLRCIFDIGKITGQEKLARNKVEGLRRRIQSNLSR